MIFYIFYALCVINKYLTSGNRVCRSYQVIAFHFLSIIVKCCVLKLIWSLQFIITITAVTNTSLEFFLTFIWLWNVTKIYKPVYVTVNLIKCFLKSLIKIRYASFLILLSIRTMMIFSRCIAIFQITYRCIYDNELLSDS
jgi:hypothetical protein